MALEEDDAVAGIPEWVVTFGDMMSLLLTFFIMLVSMSEIKEDEKYQAMVESVRQQFGYDKSWASLLPGQNRSRNSRMTKQATAGRAKRLDTVDGGAKVDAPVGDFKQVQIIRPGSKTAVGTVVFFAAGSDQFGADQRTQIALLQAQIEGKPQKIEVRGHSTQAPQEAAGTASDPWEMAYRRCRNTMDYLVHDWGIDAKRIRLSVAGPFEPLYLDTDPEKLKHNPRVEVFMLDETVNERAGTLGERERQITDENQG